MPENSNSLKFKQIKVLLCVLSAGLAAGVLLATFMLYYYNPEGTYLAKNVLLDPENAYTLRYVEPGAKGKSDNRYVFEGAYFSFFDTRFNEMRNFPVSKQKYAEFYNHIGNEKSMGESASHIESVFNHPHSAFLSVKIRRIGEDAAKGVDSTFSRIDFAYEGDYYRIQLRQSAPGGEWAYFHHPHIYKEVMDLFDLSME